MAFTDYRQVAALPIEQQRELLAAGDPTERVWALWSLALASASTSTRDLRAVVGLEPSSGVRRHAATVLAGLADRETLASLAWLDPDSSVRASACRLLARIAPADDAPSWDLLTRALGLESLREVQLATLDGLTTRSPQCAWDACRQLLAAGELELRGAALDAALQRGFAERGFPPELREMVLREPDPGLRGRLLSRWLEVAGADEVAVGLSAANSRIVLHFLEQVRGRRPEPSWTALLPLAQRHDPEIDERLAVLAFAPLSWLMEVVRRHHDPGPPGEEADWHRLQRAALNCVSRLEEELPLAQIEGLGYQGLTIAKSLHDVVSRAVLQANAELEQQRTDPEFDDPDPWGDDPPFVVGESLLSDLERLIVHLDQ